MWIPGVLFGWSLFIGVRQIRHSLALPGIIVVGMILFFAYISLSGYSATEAAQNGLILGKISGQLPLRIFPLAEVMQTNWLAVLGEAGSIGSILILTIIHVLLNVSGLELATNQDYDLNNELRLAGISNLVSGLCGGVIGYHSLSLTGLSYRLGARSRLAGLIAAGICAIVLFFGADLVAFIPMPLLGGLLFYLGLEFLSAWVFTGRRKFNQTDFRIVLLILFIIATIGFIEGVVIGLLGVTIVFVVNYSRINVFRHISSGAEMPSKVDRTAEHRRTLSRIGTQVYVLELQGYIFFGTANAILEQIHSRTHYAGQPSLRYLVLDFRHVHGLDSSATFSFSKVHKLARSQDFKMLLCHLQPDTQAQLERSGLVANGTSIILFDDLDHALEWCEEDLLEFSQVTKKHMPVNLIQQLGDLGLSKTYTNQLKGFLERIMVEPGGYLIHQHEEASDIFFIEVGRVSIVLELEDGQKVRLRSSAMGTIVGEVSFYLNTKRTASVIAEMNTIAYRLTRQSMEEMQKQNPELVMAFNAVMLRLLSERLAASNRELASLNR